MLIGAVIGTIFALIGLARSFPRRHEPELANSRWKLPVLIVMVAACLAFIIAGPWPGFWAALLAMLLVEIGFVIAGRNPWWMQSSLEA
jgi:fatty acid desaturase